MGSGLISGIDSESEKERGHAKRKEKGKEKAEDDVVMDDPEARKKEAERLREVEGLKEETRELQKYMLPQLPRAPKLSFSPVCFSFSPT
jgi:hypothetical protein